MKKAKKILALLLCAVLLVGATIAGTVAYLTDEKAVVNTFTVGEKISMVLALSGKTKSSDDQISIGFAITDENNNIINFAHKSETWKSMWKESYCELDIPGVPANAGIYTITVYFNGMEAGSQKFEINA